MPGPLTIQPTQQTPNDVAPSEKRSIAPLPTGAPGSDTTPQQHLKKPPSAKSPDTPPPVGDVAGSKKAPQQTKSQHEHGKHSRDTPSHRASTMPKGAPQLTKVPEGRASHSGKAAPLPSGISAAGAGDRHPNAMSSQLPKSQVTSQATGAVSGDANLGRLPGTPQQGGQQIGSVSNPDSPTYPSWVPRTNLTFDHIKDPGERRKAYENQENLDFTLKAFPEVVSMTSEVERKKDSLHRNNDGEWALGREKATLGDRAAHFLQDTAVEHVAEKGLEGVLGTIAEELTGLAGVGLKLGTKVQDRHDDDKLANVGPDGDKFREQKTVGLIAERMAPAFAERTRHMFGGQFSEEDGREKLREKYWEFKEQVNTQRKNFPPPQANSIP